VKFRVINSFEIKDYISRYPVLRFAAAFDGDGLLRFAERIDGSYNFATGLPMPELILFLRQNGVKV
jgi:predicted house-cleaning NTP pyrophosphatase (Maf/HAM1 superfamily)